MSNIILPTTESSPVLFLVAAWALWRRIRNLARPQSRWGKNIRETWMEMIICLVEAAIWVDLLVVVSRTRTDSDANQEQSLPSLVFSLESVFSLSLIGAIWTLIDVNQDTFLDTARRLLGVYYCFVILGMPEPGFKTAVEIAHARSLQLCSLFTIVYRVRYGMGIADKSAAWGLQADMGNSETKLNILVLSVGTRGDVQPFIYLGMEMQSRGHRVTICALDKYRGLVERHGMQFRSAGIDNIEESKFWRKYQHMSEVMADSIPNFRENFLKIGFALYDTAKNSSADVMVVTSTVQSIALSLSEKLGIPTFVVKFAPDAPTRAFPAPGYEGDRGFKTSWIPHSVYNNSSWYHHWLRIGLATIRCKMGEVEERYRKEVLGLPKLVGGMRLREMMECPNLCAFSEVVLPTPRDWPGNFLITGWWLPPISSGTSVTDFPASATSSSSVSLQSNVTNSEVTQKAEALSSDLLEFLGLDKGVICITFGSMSPTAEAIDLMPLVIGSCERVFGKSVKILIVGSRFQSFAKKPISVPTSTPSGHSRIMVIDEAPYHLLFPRVRLVIHHGGAGTSASTIEACTPSLVIPILLWTDQPLWASQLEAVGVGFHVEQRFVLYPGREDDPTEKFLELPPRVEAEAKFLRECDAALNKLEYVSVDTEEQKKRRKVAEKVARENGVVKAANAIEYFLSAERKRLTIS